MTCSENNQKRQSELASLDLIESRVDDISNTVSGLEAQAAVTAEDLAAIRRNIDRLEPGVI